MLANQSCVGERERERERERGREREREREREDVVWEYAAPQHGLLITFQIFYTSNYSHHSCPDYYFLHTVVGKHSAVNVQC